MNIKQLAEIRRCYFIYKESISKIAERLNLSRQTIRKALKREEPSVYQRNVQPTSKLGAFKPQLVDWLELDTKLPKRQRRIKKLSVNCSEINRMR